MQVIPASNQQEVIKERMGDLLDLFLVALQQDPTAPMEQTVMLQSMGPLLFTMIQQVEALKLRSLLTCLEEIARAVNNLDYSREQYEDAVEPAIRQLVAVAGSLG